MITVICEPVEKEDIREAAERDGVEYVRAYVLLPLGIARISTTDLLKLAEEDRVIKNPASDDKLEEFVKAQAGSVMPVLELPVNPTPSIPLVHDEHGRYGGGPAPADHVRQALHGLVDHYFDNLIEGEDYAHLIAKMNEDNKFSKQMDKDYAKIYFELMMKLKMRDGQPMNEA